MPVVGERVVEGVGELLEPATRELVIGAEDEITRGDDAHGDRGRVACPARFDAGERRQEGFECADTNEVEPFEWVDVTTVGEGGGFWVDAQRAALREEDQAHDGAECGAE